MNIFDITAKQLANVLLSGGNFEPKLLEILNVFMNLVPNEKENGDNKY